jgi:hypothetical protein
MKSFRLTLPRRFRNSRRTNVQDYTLVHTEQNSDEISRSNDWGGAAPVCHRPSCHSRRKVRRTSIDGTDREAVLCRICRKAFLEASS